MVNENDINLKDPQIQKRIIEAGIIKQEQKVIYFTTFENYAMLFAEIPTEKKISKKKYSGFLVCYKSSPIEVLDEWSSNSFNGKKALKEIIEKTIEEESKKRKEIINSNERKEINNILLIGRTGDGKSALANVLIKKDDDFKEVFKESEYGVSKTEEVQSAEFNHKGIRYRIIDTPGISHTKSLEQEILSKIVKEVAHSIMYEKLNQVFFVTSSKFTEEELKAYDILKDVIFDENIKDYTTIVHTKFDNFMSPDSCKNDALKAGDDRHSGSLGYDGFVYVNNPSLNIAVTQTIDVDNEEIAKILGSDSQNNWELEGQVWEERSKKNQCIYCCYQFKGEAPHYFKETPKLHYCLTCNSKARDHYWKLKEDKEKINKENRNLSRKVLLGRLEKCKGEYYKANQDLKNLSEEITDSVVKIWIINQKIRERNSKSKELMKVCEEETERLTNLINKKIQNYIRKKDSSDSLLVMIGNLDKEQIIEKLHNITLEKVAQTSTEVLDTTVQLAAPLGPVGLAASLTLGIISGSIKIWLK